MTHTTGDDIASWQGRPDMVLLYRQGDRFVISKVTGEGNYVNPYWIDNLRAAAEAGHVVGGYDWTEPQNAMGESDPAVAGAKAGRDFLRVLRAGYGGTLPVGFLILVDFETPDWASGPWGRNIEPFMKAYLYTLKAESGAARVIVYTAPYFLRETGAEHWAWLGEDFDYWMAAPGDAIDTASMLGDDAPWPDTPTGPWEKAVMHQHQWFARSEAVVGNYDRDRFDGTPQELAALGIMPPVVADTNLGKAGEVQEPPAGKWTNYINDNGEPILVFNFGGKTSKIVGTRVVDVGISVESATEPGVVEDRSFKDEEAQNWAERRV